MSQRKNKVKPLAKIKQGDIVELENNLRAKISFVGSKENMPEDISEHIEGVTDYCIGHICFRPDEEPESVVWSLCGKRIVKAHPENDQYCLAEEDRLNIVKVVRHE